MKCERLLWALGLLSSSAIDGDAKGIACRVCGGQLPTPAAYSKHCRQHLQRIGLDRVNAIEMLCSLIEQNDYSDALRGQSMADRADPMIRACLEILGNPIPRELLVLP